MNGWHPVKAPHKIVPEHVAFLLITLVILIKLIKILRLVLRIHKLRMDE